MKKLICAILCLGLLLSMAGCGQETVVETAVAGGQTVAAETQTTESKLPSETEEAASFPVKVVDAAGREVTIETQPERLVSGYYITTSMLIALGQEEKLVGIENKANTRPIYSLSAPELLELPGVGTAKEFDLEGCAALKPDLVVLPMKLKDTVPALEDLGIPVLLANPENLQQLADTISMLGSATGAVEQAQALLGYNDATVQELSGLVAETERPAVYLAGNSSYLNTAGGKMYQNTLIEMSGGKNVAAELEDSYWAEVSYEQLLAWDPEIIVIASEADYTKEDLMKDPQLADLTAVKNGAVYAMPSTFEAWDSPVPSAMMGSRWMASILHEEAYPFETFCADVVDFYQQFYGFAVDPSQVTK